MKKILSGVCITALMLTLCMPFKAVLAANNTNVTTSSTELSNKGKRPELTEEQKQKCKELKEKFEAAKKKWSTLSKEQKNTIYALSDQSLELKKQIINQYVKLGVMDEATANSLIEQFTQRNSEMKKDGKMPLSWMYHKHK